jgi:hypothetical protein
MSTVQAQAPRAATPVPAAHQRAQSNCRTEVCPPPIGDYRGCQVWLYVQFEHRRRVDNKVLLWQHPQ